MKPNETLNDTLNRLSELRAQPPTRPNIDEWIAKQEAEQEDLQKMYNYVAALARRRYESFLVVGFTEEQSFELTKIYITL